MFIRNNYKVAKEKDGFTLYINEPFYKIKKCSHGIFYNKITGEKGGQKVSERSIIYDENFNKLVEPILLEEWEWKNE